MGWVEDKIAENISSAIGFIIVWILPLIIILGAILLAYRLKEQKNNLAKVVVGILMKIHKQDYQLANSAKKQYITLFGVKELTELLETYAATHYPENYESAKKYAGKKKLKKDHIKRQNQIDGLFQSFFPDTYQEGFTFEELSQFISYFEQFTKAQNGAYCGIGNRRATDKRWQKLFNKLNNLKIEYAYLFTDEELNNMIDDYIKNSKITVSVDIFFQLVQKLFQMGLMPTKYNESGIEDLNVAIKSYMNKLLKNIAIKITELENQHIANEEQS